METKSQGQSEESRQPISMLVTSFFAYELRWVPTVLNVVLTHWRGEDICRRMRGKLRITTRNPVNVNARKCSHELVHTCSVNGSNLGRSLCTGDRLPYERSKVILHEQADT